MDEKMQKDISSLVKSLSDKKDILEAIISILAKNKESVQLVADDTKKSVDEVLAKIGEFNETVQKEIQGTLETLNQDYESYSLSLKENSTLVKSEIEKATKEQNDRAFLRLQKLIDNIKITNGENGNDGKDADPEEVAQMVMKLIKIPEIVIETAEQQRDKLETLEGDQRLDASAIKNLDKVFKKFMGKVVTKGKNLVVGGIRFFENLSDVSITVTNKRKNLIAQYDTGNNNRWQDGIALTVSTTQPTDPKINDLWVDTN